MDTVDFQILDRGPPSRFIGSPTLRHPVFGVACDISLGLLPFLYDAVQHDNLTTTDSGKIAADRRAEFKMLT
jgi:hypothetical protein